MQLRNFSIFLGVLLGYSLLFGQDYEEIAPKEEPTSEGTIQQEQPKSQKEGANLDIVLVPSLKGMVFTDHSKHFSFEEIKDVQGVRIEGVYLPHEDRFCRQISCYLGKPLTLRLLEEIRKETTAFYAQEGYSLVGVNIPAGQEITSGVVHFVVVLGRVGEVSVEGEKYFKGEFLKRQIRTKPQEVINNKKMIEDLAWLNNNPFREVHILYEPGTKISETNVVLHVQDRVPLRLYVGYDFNGYNIAGQSRFLTGLNWGNVLGLDHRMNLQFVSSDSLKEWWGVSGNYVIPFPWRNTLKVYGSYIKSNPDLGEDYVQYGKSWQIGGRYEYPFAWGKWRQMLSGGYDFQRTNNFLSYSENLLFNKYIDISQFALSYYSAFDDSWGTTAAMATIYVSPGNMTAFNTTENFSLERSGAKSDYVYGTLEIDRMTKMPYNWTWDLSFSGQISGSKLMPTEEFSAGGHASVRGYEENEVIGDEGILLKNELRAPPFKLFFRKKSVDEMQLLGFVDMAWVNDIDQNILSKESTYIASLGLGLRYRWSRYIAFSFDYGWQLKNIVRNYEPKDRDSRAHISLVVGF